MIRTDRDALACDLAETYHIYDMREQPPERVAVFAHGLRQSSRIKMKLAGERIILTDALLAACADRLSTLVWQNTKDGQKGRNRPASLYDALTSERPAGKTDDVRAFDTPEQFEAARARLMKGGGQGG